MDSNKNGAVRKPPKRSGPLPVRDRTASFLTDTGSLIFQNHGGEVRICAIIHGETTYLVINSEQITQDCMNVFVNARRAQLQAKAKEVS